MRVCRWFALVALTACLCLLPVQTAARSSSSRSHQQQHHQQQQYEEGDEFMEINEAQIPVAAAPAPAAPAAPAPVAPVAAVPAPVAPAAAPAAKPADESNPGFISELRFDPASRERRNQPRKVVADAPSANEVAVASYRATFAFHPSQTSEGYTIDTFPEKNIEELAKACYEDVRCTAFTSTGELKSFVRPASKWVVLDTASSASINTDMKLAGIYYQPQWYRFQPVPCPCNAEVPLNFVCSDPNSGDQYLGDPLTDSSCYRPKPAVVSHKCNPTTCINLAWTVKEFDECPTCGLNVTISREVKCISQQGTVFPNKFCKYVGEKPAKTKTCDASVECQWNKVNGPCKAPCGRGYMSINVTCISPVDQKVIPDNFCTTVKPKTVRKCKAKDCVWNTVPDGTCSFSCGPGHRQLKATCIEAGKPDVVLPDMQCGGVRRPSVLVKCNNRPCNWETKPTSPCSQPCGKGQQTVANTCKDPLTGDVMPAKQCSSDPPPSFQYCSLRSCEWDTTPFGACSNSCGTGEQLFNVTCRDPKTSHRVDDAQCNLLRPPAPKAPCENNACGWVSRPIGECSVPCGSGVQKLNVTCEDPITGALIDESKCGSNKPNSTSVCHVRECHWHRTSKGSCSSPCGSGIQAYKLSCRNPEDGKKQKMAQCKNVAVPALTEPCTLHACQWQAANDGQCSSICGPGRQKRTISCHDPLSKKRVEPELCTDKAPSQNTKCYAQACVWSTAPTTQCSASCGTGTQSVNVTCTDPKKRFVLPDSQCFDASRPNVTQPCNLQACHWKTTPASACSSTCGQGTQKLNVLCADPLDGKEQDIKQCDEDTKPVANATCNVKPCTWVSDPPVAKCSEVCGPGHVAVNVTCQDAQAGIVYPDRLCHPDVKPAGMQPCQIAECKWSAKWTDCPATCGGEFQFANLTCTHEDGTLVSNTQCKASPPAWRQCATQACTHIEQAFLHYSFEDDVAGAGKPVINRVSDAKKYGLDGIVQGAGAKSFGGRGGLGAGIQLPASGDHTSGPHVVIPEGKALTSPSFSLSFWMQLQATPTKGRFYIIVDNRGTKGGGEGFVIYLDPRDGLLYLNDAYSAKLGKSHFADSGVAFPNDSKYHHVSVTYNQKLVRFFLDGKQTSVIDPSHAFKFTVSIAQHRVYLRGSPDKYWRYLPMALDEFAYFSYPLSDAQVTILADAKVKNVCAAGQRLTGGGCTRYANPGSALNARCAAAPYSLTQCLQPLWGLHGCGSMGTSYPTTSGDVALWNAQAWREVKKTVASFAARDKEPQLQAKKAWGTCQNRTPSGLDHLCDHPAPFHTAVCLQGLFLELGCSRRASGFPASASHPLTRQLNELSWRDVKAKMQTIIKGDVRGGPSEGVCHDPTPDVDTL